MRNANLQVVEVAESTTEGESESATETRLRNLLGDYTPKASEAAAAVAVLDRWHDAREQIEVRIVVDDDVPNARVQPRHASPVIGPLLLAEALGVNSPAEATQRVADLANATAKGGRPHERDLNAVLLTAQSIGPTDPTESLLACQMALVHDATMEAARRLKRSENLAQMEANDGALNRLARTFAAQMEALKRYRTGGQQKVTVEHVTVESGGQAIVGAVTHAPRGRGHAGKRGATS
jgi:hypothetical protein